MNEFSRLEVKGRRRYFHDSVISDTSGQKPTDSFHNKLQSILELLLCDEVESKRFVLDEYIDIFEYCKSELRNNISSLSAPVVRTALYLSVVYGSDDDFEFFCRAVDLLEINERKNKTYPLYLLFKCLSALWRKDTEKVKSILTMLPDKPNKKLGLRAMPLAISRLLEGDKELFLESIDNTRAEHARTQKSPFASDQSFACGVIDLYTLSMIKVAQRYGIEVAPEIPERFDTFKFLPRYIEDIEMSDRAEWTVDHLFPLKYWKRCVIS